MEKSLFTVNTVARVSMTQVLFKNTSVSTLEKDHISVNSVSRVSIVWVTIRDTSASTLEVNLRHRHCWTDSGVNSAKAKVRQVGFPALDTSNMGRVVGAHARACMRDGRKHDQTGVSVSVRLTDCEIPKQTWRRHRHRGLLISPTAHLSDCRAFACG